jgi:hypothetical protein
MPSVQEVFSVSSPQEFTDYVTWCNYIVNYPCDGVAIVKGNPHSNMEIRPPVKGLIFNPNTGDIIAPGLQVILEPEGKPACEPVGFAMALDGVGFRIYRYNGKVHCSTSGMFDPTNGRWGSSNKTFGDLFKEVASQVNLDNIKDGLCYHAILEHSDQPGVYRPTDSYAMLTLVRVSDLWGNSVPMEQLVNFNAAFERILEYRNGKPSETDLAFLDEEAGAEPVQYDKYGLVVYYENGEVVRYLSKHAQKAVSLLPNFPNVWQHWIYCYRKDGMNCINEYTSMFPWRAEEFNRYSSAFLSNSAISNSTTMTNAAIKDLILKQPELQIQSPAPIDAPPPPLAEVGASGPAPAAAPEPAPAAAPESAPAQNCTIS